MSAPQLPILPPTSGLDMSAVLPYFLAAMTGVLGWFGAQFTAGAQLQKTILDASRLWVEQSQEMLAHRDARISALENELSHMRLECLQHSGEIRGLKQTRDSLTALIKRAGVEIPGDGN